MLANDINEFRRLTRVRVFLAKPFQEIEGNSGELLPLVLPFSMSSDTFKFSRLAVPGVCLLISGLAYGSQLLFPLIEPGPLTKKQLWTFNGLVVCIWICYSRAVLVNPGHVPSSWQTEGTVDVNEDGPLGRQRFCRKCQALKPPRAHHCKVCKRYTPSTSMTKTIALTYGRCIPKMDHHCPWTANCVSHSTFPHFMRFLFYAVASMTYLEGLLYDRAAAVWRAKDLRYVSCPLPSHIRC